MKTVSFKTLGCRMNQYETDSLVTEFHRGGYRIAGWDDHADVYIINTCTVTNQSDQKSRNIINQAIQKHEGAVVVVAGCMVNNFRDVWQNDGRITYAIDNEHKSSIFSLIDSHFKGEILHPEQLNSDVFGFKAVGKSLHTRTSIKIQDGCNNFCSYCIVPKVRGRAVSRPAGDILENVRKVIDTGFKEIVITGVNIGRYDHEGMNIERLLEQILEVPGNFRLRISSIEPDGFGKDFSKLFHHPRLTPHLHLCLQSGSDEILMRMRRGYTIRDFMNIINGFRKEQPDFNFTTDIITGFPGETDHDFEQSCRVVKEIGFSHIHTFRYSSRKGTRAERMDGQVPDRIRSERSKRIREISDQNKARYYHSMIGKEQTVLVEKTNRQGVAQGYGEHYIRLTFRKPAIETNTFHTLVLNKENLLINTGGDDDL